MLTLEACLSLYVLIVSALLFFLSACMIERPSVKDPAARLTVFSHSAKITSCKACHQNLLPNSGHGNGLDCIGCHTAGMAWSQAKNFDHNPVPSSCVSCHQAHRPIDSNIMRIRNPNFGDQSHFAKRDCTECHRSLNRAQSPTISPWAFTHQNSRSALVENCLPCHYSQGLREHRRKTVYFEQNGKCQECHTSTQSWDN
jgi:hypothetical protein